MTIAIDQVSLLPAPRLAAGRLDTPQAGSYGSRCGLELRGWLVGEPLPIEAIEIWAGARRIAKLPVNAPPPPPARDLPQHEWAKRSGFEGFVPLLGLPERFELQCIALDARWQRYPVAILSGQRSEGLPAPSSGPAPLLITTYGRTGSTWLTHILGQHPQIAAWRAFETETFLAEACLEHALSFAAERPLRAALGARDLGPGWFAGLQRPTLDAGQLSPALEAFAAGPGAEAALASARQRAQAVAGVLAAELGKPEARYWIDKCQHPGILPAMTEFLPGTRELIGIREPRDMLCSMRSFGSEGGRGFGRERLPDDASWIRWLGRELGDLGRSFSERDPATTMLVRYEDLMDHPEPLLAAVLELLGLPSEAPSAGQLLEQAERSRRDRQARHRTGKRRTVGRFREDLPPELLPIANEAFADAFKAFAYAHDGEALPLEDHHA